MPITPEYIIKEADKNIEILLEMMRENSSNTREYEYKLAVMQLCKRRAARMLAKKREQEA